MKAAFATRLAGSQDLYGPSGRRPHHSINFIIAHDGFTLADLVSYNEKHNDANGEGNRDGTNDNFSWNCGAEGRGAGGEGVAALRGRQMRNLHLALMLSQGTPMLLAGEARRRRRRRRRSSSSSAPWSARTSPVHANSPISPPDRTESTAPPHYPFRVPASLLTPRPPPPPPPPPSPAGDEYAQSREGNNNWYGHDSRLSHYRWDELAAARAEPGGGWFRFYTELVKLRRACPLLGRPDFLTPADVTWHEDRWDDPESRFLAFTLHDSGNTGHGDLYAAFNAHSFQVEAQLPAPPAGKKWARVVDSNLPPPRDFTAGGNAGVEAVYSMAPHSSILLLAKDA
jgi:isoamylase